jgi:Transposase and inactivated derivatives
MTKKERVQYRYSNCFKLTVVAAIEKEGLSIEEARRRYGIGGGSTIQRWIRKFGKNELLNKVVKVSTVEERDELTRLREENKQLKIAYAELALHHKLSESVIEISDEMFGLDLKKKYAQELLKHTKEKKK